MVCSNFNRWPATCMYSVPSVSLYMYMYMYMTVDLYMHVHVCPCTVYVMCALYTYIHVVISIILSMSLACFVTLLYDCLWYLRYLLSVIIVILVHVCN